MSSNQSNNTTLIRQGNPQPNLHNHNFSGSNSFKPLKTCINYTLNAFTKLENATLLMDAAKLTKTFSIYTRRELYTDQVSLIIIEFLQIDQIESIVLTFDLLHLPHKNSTAFTIFKSILLYIFDSDKRCFIWNDEQKQNLYAFVECDLVADLILGSIHIIKLEQAFKDWYYRTFHNNQYRDENWPLLKALQRVFNEFIPIVNESLIHIPQGIQFSILSCMVLTKFSMVLELNWSIEQLNQFLRYHQCKIKNFFYF